MIGNKTVVYTSGTFDMLHINHLKMIEYARALGDILIVGVNTDELVASYKSTPIIPFEERIEIVRSIKYVDAAIPQEDIDKFEAWKKLHFDVLFVGDDWYNSDRWEEMEKKFKEVGVRVVYFPYTKGTSSTLINQTLLDLRNKNAGGLSDG